MTRPKATLHLDRTATVCTLALVALFAITASAIAQTQTQTQLQTQPHDRHAWLAQFATKLGPPQSPAHQSVVGIAVNQSDVALGTVIPRPSWIPDTPDAQRSAWVLTKNSEVPLAATDPDTPTDLRVVTADGVAWPAQALARDRATDLLLLRVPAIRSVPPQTTDAPTPAPNPTPTPNWSWPAQPVAFPEPNANPPTPAPTPTPGQWLILPGIATPPETNGILSVGIVSGPPRALPSQAKMGVFFAQGTAQPLVRMVQADSGAQAAGLQRGDVIQSVNGQPTPTPLAVIDAVQGKLAGESIAVTVQRQNQTLLLRVELGVASPRNANRQDRIEQLAGSVSTRRDGFPSILPIDARLPANRCGGPAFTLQNNQPRWAGIAIARTGRIETLVLPVPQIRAALQRMAPTP